MRRCAIYARLSDDAGGEKEGVDRQIAACRRYAEAQGWDVVEVIRDDSVSAWKLALEDRPGGARLEELVMGRKVDVVLAWKLDRLSRTVRDGTALLARWSEVGVAVALESGEAVDTSTPVGRLLVSMLLTVAESEAENTSYRQKAARKAATLAGQHWGKVPLGYRLVRNEAGKPVLELDPEAAAALRVGARMLLDRQPYRVVSEYLRRKGVSTSSNVTSVGNLYRNPRMAGYGIYRKEVIRDEDGKPIRFINPSVLEPSQWQRVLSELDRRGFHRGSPKKRLFSGGVVKCLECEGPLYYAPVTTKVGTEYLRCARRGKLGRGCKGVSITSAGLEAWVVSQMRIRLTKEALEASGERFSVEAQERRVAELEERVRVLQRCLRDTRDAVAIGVVVAELERVGLLLGGAQVDLEVAKSRRVKLPEVDGAVLADRWESLTVEQRRRVMLRCVSEVSVGLSEKKVQFIWEPTCAPL